VTAHATSVGRASFVANYSLSVQTVVSVMPPSFGGRTSMQVRALNESGTEVDRFTLSRQS
jgi:hypothetical protein